MAAPSIVGLRVVKDRQVSATHVVVDLELPAVRDAVNMAVQFEVAWNSGMLLSSYKWQPAVVCRPQLPPKFSQPAGHVPGDRLRLNRMERRLRKVCKSLTTLRRTDRASTIRAKTFLIANEAKEGALRPVRIRARLVPTAKNYGEGGEPDIGVGRNWSKIKIEMDFENAGPWMYFDGKDGAENDAKDFQGTVDFVPLTWVEGHEALLKLPVGLNATEVKVWNPASAEADTPAPSGAAAAAGGAAAAAASDEGNGDGESGED